MSIKIKYSHASNQTKLEVQEFLKEWENSLLSLLVKTSGSTSSPKIIELEKSKMSVSAEKTIDFLKIKKHETAFLCLSPSTIAGKMMIVRSTVGNLNLIVGPVDSNPLKNIVTHIDFIALVPLQLQKILEENPERLKNIRSIIVGGGPISNELEELIKSNGLTVYHTFGMTETISHVAMRKVGIEEQKEFHALPGVHFGVNENKLIINYPELGFLGLETNDLVALTSPTTFIWKGRADFVINSGGVKVHPEEVESLLSESIKSPFFIGNLSDPLLGQKVILIIESEKNQNFKRADFIGKLPKHSIPKEIYYIPTFSITKSGKINRLETLKSIDENVIKEVL